MNEGSIEDYIDLQRMMFMLNENYRSKSFSIFGGTSVATAFRQVVASFESNGTRPTSEIKGGRGNGQALAAQSTGYTE
jgi:hypothetical protein